ncbi:hypothetical protein 035JT004_156 [Bacillus phage 035JT004]|nr:hypothetical protein 035JT004_156 [Bacillus phage 035JT004]
MTMGMNRDLEDFGYRIARAKYHGGSFYSEGELLSFLSDLRKLGELTKNYAENQEENLDD